MFYFFIYSKLLKPHVSMSLCIMHGLCSNVGHRVTFDHISNGGDVWNHLFDIGEERKFYIMKSDDSRNVK